MTLILRSFPDHEILPECHHKNVEDSLLFQESGRKKGHEITTSHEQNLIKQYEDNVVSPDMTSKSNFCDKYIVTEKVVRDHIELSKI